MDTGSRVGELETSWVRWAAVSGNLIVLVAPRVEMPRGQPKQVHELLRR